jgi:hypothetical protein
MFVTSHLANEGVYIARATAQAQEGNGAGAKHPRVTYSAASHGNWRQLVDEMSYMIAPTSTCIMQSQSYQIRITVRDVAG